MRTSKNHENSAPATSQPSTTRKGSSVKPELPQPKKTSKKRIVATAKRTTSTFPPSASICSSALPSPSGTEPTPDKFVSTCQASIQFGYVNVSRTFPNAIPKVIRETDIQVLFCPEMFEQLETEVAKCFLGKDRRRPMAMYLNSVINEALLHISPEHFTAGAESIAYTDYIDSLEEYGAAYEELGTYLCVQISLQMMRPGDTSRCLVFMVPNYADINALSAKGNELYFAAVSKYCRALKE